MANRVNFEDDEEQKRKEDEFVKAAASSKSKPAEPSPVRRKIPKTLKLYEDHADMLEDQAHLMTREKRTRTTQSDIIAEALEAWAKAKKVDMKKYR